MTYYQLTWAPRLHNFESDNLRAPNGMYWDHIPAGGTIEEHFVSYNQGVMLGANLAFAGETGRKTYVAAAAYDAIYYQSRADLAAVSSGSVSLAPVSVFVSSAWPAANAIEPAHHRTEDDLLEQVTFIVAATTV